MSTKGQTINDRLNAAKYTLAGQSLARCICKATTEELMKPKKKHLDYLTASTYESNVSMMQLANLLIERTNHSNWAVVYKALVTVHHLMSFGNERFTQYLASSNYSFQLSGFLDRIVAKGYAMSTFIRRYSNYINQKALSYRTLAIDLCRTQRAEDNVLRTMPIERLLETLPVIQKQLDVLLDFGCTDKDLTNSIITASFTLLFHDAIRLFASYNDGIINLFEKYFDLNKKMCREAFEAYKKFLSCTDRIADFLKIAEAIDLNRGELPDFKRAPSSLLDALEQHLISLETNKKRDKAIHVDTKSAAFPSFSVSDNFDFAPPTLSDISKDFEAQLAFANDDGEYEKSSNKSSSTELNTITKSPTPSASPAVVDSSLNIRESPNEFDAQFKPTSSFTDLKKDDDVFDTAISKNDIFDAMPPGYLDGGLLKPETSLQISIDSSIDPQTKQQLIQIKREQVANKQQWQSGNNTSSMGLNGQNNNYTSGRQITAKTKKESVFEDLEKTMRQSLQKIEKT